MSWFGLFDRVHLRNSADAVGTPLPGSQLCLEDLNIAALYREAVLAQGDTYRCDLFDIASHDLARRSPAAPGSYHLDIRLCGREQALLFHGDAGHGLIAWHAESGRGTLRLPGRLPGRVPGRLAGGGDAVTMEALSLWPLIEQTIAVRTVASLAIWAPDAAAAEAVLRRLAPYMLADTGLILRLLPEALAPALAMLGGWPAHCAAVIPCTGAADPDGRGEDPTSLLICVDHLSTRTAPAASPDIPAPSLPAPARELWNDKDRVWRAAQQSGVAVRLPLPDRTLTGGWRAAVVGEIPPTVLGVSAARLQTTAFRATAGFDYVLDISAATIVRSGDLVAIHPVDGPVVVAPASLRGCDAAEPQSGDHATQAAQRLLAAHGWLAPQGIVLPQQHPATRLSQRPAFLLTGPCPTEIYIGEIWPTLEYVFQICEQNRLTLSDIDILIPGVTDPVVRQSLELLGIEPASIIDAPEGILFRQLLAAPPASDGNKAQRAAAFDQFWARAAGLIRTDSHASFTRLRHSGRVMLTGGGGPSLLNLSQLHDAARRRGYDVIDPAAMRLGEVAAILAGASAIVGTGPALAWTCLATTAQVGAILSDTGSALPYAALHAASARGFNVSLVFGSSTGGAGSPVFTLAQDRFEALLDRLAGSTRPIAATASDPGRPSPTAIEAAR